MSSPVSIHAPILADVDGDGRTEIVSLKRPDTQSIDKVLAFHSDSSPVLGWPLDLFKWPTMGYNFPNFQAPAIADIDNDGNLELAVSPGSGMFYVVKLPGSSSTVQLDWPMPYHDSQRTCTYARSKAEQMITVTGHAPATATYQSSFMVSASSSSGLEVAVTTTGGCTGNGTGSAMITMTSGTTACVVHFNQAGNSNYKPAPEVTESSSAQKADSTTVLVTSGSPSTYGQLVTFTATVTNGATGTVSFTEGIATYCSSVSLVMGFATCSTSSLGAGPHIITATYNGDANYSGSSGTVSQTVNAPSILASPSTLNFNPQNVGTTSSPGTITITNGGTGNLVIGNITVAGTNAGEFSVQQDNCSGRTIIPSSSCTVQAVFSPTAIGSRSANLSLPSNDTLKNPLSVGLTGSGMDTLPPTGSIIIKGGAAAAKSRTVTLTLSASDPSGVSQMCISNTTSCTSWVTYSTSKSWTLTTGDETKTVYAWFKDTLGYANATPYSDSIILDTKAPVTTASPLGGSYGAAQTVTLDCNDGTGSGCAKTYYTTDGTTPTVSSSVYTAALSIGVNTTLKYFSQDLAGNNGAVKTQAYVIDTIPPTGTVLINGNAAYTKSTSVTLSLACTDNNKCTQMQFSNDNLTWGAASSFAATKAWTLLTGDGSKTVYARFKDAAGNWSDTVSDSIILDRTAPTNGTVTAVPGDTQVTLNWSGFNDALSGVASYKVVYSIGSGPSGCSSGTTIYSGTDTSYPHTGLTNGTTYYYRVCAIDNAGNVSTGATRSATPAP